MSIPEKWWLKPKKGEQVEILTRWIYNNSKCHYATNSSILEGFYFPNFFDFNGFSNGNHTGSYLKSSPYNQYAKISFEDFLKYIVNKEPQITEYLIHN